VCERLPEHPREQDCVTRPLPSLFRFRLFSIFQPYHPSAPKISCQLPGAPPKLLLLGWESSSVLLITCRRDLRTCA